MELEILTSGRETRLILIFAGWSTGADHYRDCVFSGWDTAVVSDYRDLTPPDIPSRYRTVYIFAYSLGVFAASLTDIPAAVRIAICGTQRPVSDLYGIPESIYRGTAETLSERNLIKFHRRMAGSREAYERLAATLPAEWDIDALKEELWSIMAASEHSDNSDPLLNIPKFHRVYIASSDAIFPPENQLRYWRQFAETEIVEIEGPHAVDIAAIIRSVLPNPTVVGRGFEEALPCYRENAIVQGEVCRFIGEKLGESGMGKGEELGERGMEKGEGVKVLEIGAGCGMLTEVWSGMVKAREATFVDLYDLPRFRVAPDERYVTADAERWLEETDEKFDLILSASAMQWFADPIRFIDEVRKHLNPGGIGLLSTFVKGNLAELDVLRPSPIIYRTEEEYRKGAPSDAEIVTEIVSWSRKLSFGSRKELLMHLKRTGVVGTTSPIRVPLTAYPTELTYRPLVVKV